MGWLGAITTTFLMAFSLGWALLPLGARATRTNLYIGKFSPVPCGLWVIAGSAFFLLPVLTYWLSAHSHGNAIAGLLPWNDASGYYGCAESYLLGAKAAPDCGRRPFYITFFASLLWLSGNKLQLALLLQAAILGGAVVLFLRMVSKDLNGPGILAAYCVLFLFAVKFCASLVMTENVGLILGCLALALLWNSARDPHWHTFCAGCFIMTASLNTRAGAMLILPAILAWALFQSGNSLRRRIILAGLGLLSIVAGFVITTLPTLIVDGELTATQSNFAYSFYGLVVGGKGWLQVTRDHPEIFTQSGIAVSETQAIYRAAFKSILSQPHLLAVGYLKGLNHYFGELFKFAHDFKPLRFLLFTPLWLAGFWFAVRRWRESRYALMLWLQAGILASSPFITFDGGNRVYAATMPIDAMFVGIGVMWISASFQVMSDIAIKQNATVKESRALLFAAIAMILVPIGTLIAIRLGNTKIQYSQPVCASGLEGVVVRPGRSSPMLTLSAPGEETIFPLRVRADHLAQSVHKTVHNAIEFHRKPGTILIWGIRLDEGHLSAPVMFSWNGTALTAGELAGFCVTPPETGSSLNIGTATKIFYNLSLR